MVWDRQGSGLEWEEGRKEGRKEGSKQASKEGRKKRKARKEAREVGCEREDALCDGVFLREVLDTIDVTSIQFKGLILVVGSLKMGNMGQCNA